MKASVKYILLLSLTIIIVSCIVSCGNSSDKYQPNQPIYATLPPYSEVGSSNSNNCNHQNRTVFSKNTESGEIESIVACTNCGYSSSGYKYYHTQSDYNKACVNGNKYSGESKKIIINLNSNYNYSTFEFQSNVDEIVFVGTEGQTNSNMKIKVLNRKSNIIFDFSNVNISSQDTILISDECDAKIIVRTHGNSNSFATQRAADGKNGDNGWTYYGQQTAHSGERGGDASDVFSVNGDIEFIVYSSISIHGGRGGNGGNGASLTSVGPTSGGGGSGGNGGDGGDAIDAKGSVTVRGNTNLVDFEGGDGGYGGTGGYGRNQSSKASDGYKGNKGKSGLE